MELSNLEKMLVTNKEQKKYYEGENDKYLEKKGNLFTQIWGKMRKAQILYRKAVNIDDLVYNLHIEWLGDLKDKTVLDLGCYGGNHLSLYIAENSKDYTGIDLSESAIQLLNNNIKERNIENARGLAVDFLSDDFQKENKGKFDVIYAHAVLHHFKYFEEVLKKCQNCLKEDGIIISFDPLQTYIPMYLLRMLYRPFQSDRDWEYPFKRENIKLIKKYFEIKSINGIMGRSKLGLFIYIINKKLGTALGKKWFEQDKSKASKEGWHLYNCLQITMLLKNTNTISKKLG